LYTVNLKVLERNRSRYNSRCHCGIAFKEWRCWQIIWKPVSGPRFETDNSQIQSRIAHKL